MPNERVIEIPWMLNHLPQNGYILDVGSCEAQYLNLLPTSDRVIHCLDPRNCHEEIPAECEFHVESILGTSLPESFFDAVICLSTLEHIGMPHYEQDPFEDGDDLALNEMWRVLKPGGLLILTMPSGIRKWASWYRQYDPAAIRDLLGDYWDFTVTYWGFDGASYQIIGEDQVTRYDYYDVLTTEQRAGCVAGVLAYKKQT